jgi:hypothetical protein
LSRPDRSRSGDSTPWTGPDAPVPSLSPFLRGLVSPGYNSSSSSFGRRTEIAASLVRTEAPAFLVVRLHSALPAPAPSTRHFRSSFGSFVLSLFGRRLTQFVRPASRNREFVRTHRSPGHPCPLGSFGSFSTGAFNPSLPEFVRQTPSGGLSSAAASPSSFGRRPATVGSSIHSKSPAFPVVRVRSALPAGGPQPGPSGVRSADSPLSRILLDAPELRPSFLPEFVRHDSRADSRQSVPEFVRQAPHRLRFAWTRREPGPSHSSLRASRTLSDRIERTTL